MKKISGIYTDATLNMKKKAGKGNKSKEISIINKSLTPNKNIFYNDCSDALTKFCFNDGVYKNKDDNIHKKNKA